MGVAPVLGAILGGLITTHLGWRWGFYINVPIGFALMAVGFGSVSESRDPQAARLDVVGILFFGAGLSTLVWPLIEANRVGWGSPQTLIKLAIGVALLVIFVFAERRHPRPMIDLTLFKAPAVIGAAAAMLGYAAACQLMMTILPVYLQDAFDQSAAQAGVAMISFALPLLVGPSLGAALAARLSGRALLTIGLAMVAVGDAVLAVAVCAEARYWAMMVGMAIVGLATGVLNSETTKAQVSAVPPDRAGMASGIAGTTRFIGLTVGLTGIGAILTAAAENGLRRLGTQVVSADSADWHAVNLRIVGGDAAGALSDLPLAIRMVLGHAVRASVASGFTAAFTAAAVTAMVTSILAWYLLRGTRPSAPPPR
ncbi:MFS transporter [Candidatus Sodalis pierantonius]|uniref:MFS transporter n=1 Tax=Candidatus Sodalis pierantonii TaxID=1486991 RepID=UPI0006846F6E